MSTIAAEVTGKVTEAELREFIPEFYRQADNSAPLVWFLPFIEEDHHMVWTPTCEFRGQVGFEEFYRNLTSNLFDRNHDVTDVKIAEEQGVTVATFTIHLTAKVWQQPLAKSIHAENFANFRWTVRRSEKTGKIAIMDYFLTGVRFPEGSIIVNADVVFKYPTWMYGPWQFP
jgi:hypothetical protein